MAVGTNYYIRVLLSAFVYPADMPRQWCAHLWGCLWGIGGCYPSRTPSLVLAPGWWPGGLIPYLKDVGYRYRGVQPDGDRDRYLPNILPHIRPHIAGRGSLLRPPAHVRATGLSGLGAGRLTGAPVSHPSLTHAHTRHTRPGPAVPLKPLSGGLHWSGCLAAGRRCGALEARRTGAASLRDGQGQGAWWGRGGSRERS